MIPKRLPRLPGRLSRPPTPADRWSGLLGPAPDDDSPEAEAIRVEQLAGLGRQSPRLPLASALTALLVAAAIAPMAPAGFAAAWSALLVALALLLLPGWWRHRRRSGTPAVAPRAARRTIVYAGATGLVWGVGIAVMLPPESLAHQVFLLVAFVGVAAGGLMALAVLPGATLVYSGALMLPVLLRLALFATPMHLAIAGLLVIFAAAMVLIAREHFRSLVDNVLIHVTNRRLAAELKASRIDLADAIEGINEPIANFDAEGRLLTWNDKFREMFPDSKFRFRSGARFAELLQYLVPSSEIEGQKMSPEEWRRWRLQHFRSAAGAFEHRKPDGRWFHSYDMRTRRGGVLCVHHDISEMKSREAAHERAKTEAEVANSAKSRFLALMSHELRTPLNAIIGFAELLESETLGPHSIPQYRDYANSIRTAGDHLLKVINDILDLSKVESGRMEIQAQEFAAAGVVDDVARLMAETARRSGIKLTQEIQPDLPVLCADMRAVRQMLINLLYNAIKFTESGGSVTVAAWRDDDGLAIAVRDTGIGMSPEDVEAAMEPFVQAGKPHHAHQQGTGLGLPLVRALMELHGGKLHLASTPGKGTTATLRFSAASLVAAPGAPAGAD